MKKLKVMVIIGTRPEIIKLSEIIKKINQCFNLVLVHTGQNYDYELNTIFFENFKLKEPDYYLNSVGKHLGETVGNIIAKSYEIMFKEKPDALLILGDTNSCLAAYSAKRLKIPIFHMEAGNRCFDMNVPEEINRKMIDHISDINLAYTENSRKYLINEGFKNDSVFVTGSPMKEVLNKYKNNIEKSEILKTLNLNTNKYFVISLHREENVDNPIKFKQLIETINEIVKKYQYPVIFSTHPRTQKRLEENKVKLDKLVKNIKPLGFFDYINLEKNAFCVISDSGTLAEETAILNFKSISIRDSSERPEAIDSGSLILGNIDKDNVLSSIFIATTLNNSNKVIDYENDIVSTTIVKIIQSYCDIVNKRTWKK